MWRAAFTVRCVSTPSTSSCTVCAFWVGWSCYLSELDPCFLLFHPPMGHQIVKHLPYKEKTQIPFTQISTLKLRHKQPLSYTCIHVHAQFVLYKTVYPSMFTHLTKCCISLANTSQLHNTIQLYIHVHIRIYTCTLILYVHVQGSFTTKMYIN